MKLKLYLNWVHLLTKFGPNLAIACPDLAATRKQNQFRLAKTFVFLVYFFNVLGPRVGQKVLFEYIGP